MELMVLKLALKNWKKTSFDIPKARTQLLRQNIEKVLNQLSEDPTNVQYQNEELNLQEELGSWLGKKEVQWKQKSTESWMHLGDRNTKFFHSAVKANHARYSTKILIGTYSQKRLSRGS